ncbi:MAG: hypothetical protein ACYDDO_12440 [Acidiferrobacterales bacterium]
MTVQNSFKGLMLFMLPLILAGCGKGNDAPPAGTITIQASTTSWNVPASGSVNTISYVSQPVLVTVRDSSGIPLTGIAVTLSLDLSSGTVPVGSEDMAMYLTDPNGIPKPASVTSPIVEKTGSSGTIALWIVMATGGNGTTFDYNYKGILYADSGALQGTASLSVTCVNVTGPPAINCK